MALSWHPVPYWSYAAMVLAAAAVLTHILGYKRLGAKQGMRVLLVALTGLTAVLLASAAFNPILTPAPALPKLHFAVLVDVSDSVLRDQDNWSQMQQNVEQLLIATMNEAPDDIAEAATASLTTFGAGLSSVEQNLPLSDLSGAFARLTQADFAAGNATDIERALKDAERRIQRAGNQGAILLISDGNETMGTVVEMAKRLGQQTIPVYVYPLISPPPGIAIASTYLPERIDGRVPANLRLILQNQSENPVNIQLAIEQNPGLSTADSLFGEPLVSNSLQSIPIQGSAFATQTLSFAGIGLQFVDVTLKPETEDVEHRRRLFTHVTRPVRVLAVGGDNRWLEALSPDTTIVISTTPSELTPAYDLKEVDVVAISGVPAGAFPAGTLQMLADANVQNGVGIFLINGDHTGADIEEDPTVLMTYDNTPIEKLLPLTTDTRVFYEQPPTRSVVILIDRSGSMGEGNNLQLAKQVAIYIVQNLLRDADYLDVIAFDDRAYPIVTNLAMNVAGKGEAVASINGISIGGGTHPGVALASMKARQLAHCGLIFISDGKFAAAELSQRPECQATTFAIGQDVVSLDAPIRLLADPFPVTDNFNPANITIPYFEPEERNKNFEPGEYMPRADSYSGQQLYALPVPELPLEGNAISVLTYTEEAIQIAVRPRFADPILAYKENENGYVGVLATAFPETWQLDENGRQAIDAWIKRTVPYLARDRYDFQIEEQGNTLLLQISFGAQNGVIPDVQSISVMLEMADGDQKPGTFTAVEDIPSLFRGEISLDERDNTAQPAYLVVTEGSGADALPRPQRIPFLIPPFTAQSDKPHLDEMYTYGENADLLRTLATVSKGIYNPEDSISLFRSQSTQPPTTPLWPFFVIAATVSYLFAIALRRLNP